MDELRAKSADRRGEIGKNAAEVSRLYVELDKKTALIAALRARDEVRRSAFRRIAKILLYLYMRSKRRPRPVLVVPEQHPLWELTRPGPNELAAAAALNVKRRQAVSRSH
jgi:hypothetical protein